MILLRQGLRRTRVAALQAAQAEAFALRHPLPTLYAYSEHAPSYAKSLRRAGHAPYIPVKLVTEMVLELIQPTWPSMAT